MYDKKKIPYYSDRIFFYSEYFRINEREYRTYICNYIFSDHLAVIGDFSVELNSFYNI